MGPGNKDLVVEGYGIELCGATGNCTFLLLRPTSAGFRVVLSGIADTYTLRPHAESGKPEIILSMHDSATEKELYHYQFCKGKFREIAVYDYSTSDGINELPTPEITLERRINSVASREAARSE